MIKYFVGMMSGDGAGGNNNNVDIGVIGGESGDGKVEGDVMNWGENFLEIGNGNGNDDRTGNDDGKEERKVEREKNGDRKAEGNGGGGMFDGLGDFGVDVGDGAGIMMLDGVALGGDDGEGWEMGPGGYDGLDLGDAGVEGLDLGLVGGAMLKKEEEVVDDGLEVASQGVAMSGSVRSGDMMGGRIASEEQAEERATSVPLTGAEKKSSAAAGPVRNRRGSGRQTARRVAARPLGVNVGVSYNQSRITERTIAAATAEAEVSARREGTLLAHIRKLQDQIATLDVNSRLNMRDALNSLSNKAANPAMIPTPEQEAMNRAAEYLVLRMLFVSGPQSVMHTAPGTAPPFVPDANLGGPMAGMMGTQPVMPDGAQVVPGYLQHVTPMLGGLRHFHPHGMQQQQQTQTSHPLQATPLAPSPLSQMPAPLSSRTITSPTLQEQHEQRNQIPNLEQGQLSQDPGR